MNIKQYIIITITMTIISINPIHANQGYETWVQDKEERCKRINCTGVFGWLAHKYNDTSTTYNNDTDNVSIEYDEYNDQYNDRDDPQYEDLY